ncbi:DUF2220 family protein [Colwellia sp. MSW7]|uniref:DUF2220 family protein n=1 Tax=Colwellia maritima TaxID=2912588 RepID=A0ABS9X7B3_9GAMM|nr:Wadjet anti-phage system protein JetD domain-containing protein [Colwellia maritima]MCI2286118.1 DUF2220 family protein [Colwellia maritima]
MPEAIDIIKIELIKFIGEPGTKQLNPGTLIKRLIDKTSLSSIDVQQALLQLSKAGLITGINVRGIPVKKVAWTDIRHQPVSESRKLVESVVDEVTNDQQIRNIFIKHHKYFDGFNEQDIAKILKGLLAIKGSGVMHSHDRYIFSARHLLGSSKALDNISRLTKELGISLPHDESTYYILTAGQPTSSQVLFVENPRVFNYLKPYAHKYNTLIISSYGYGLTLENFADKITSNSIIACPTDNQPQPDLKAILIKSLVIFWGDLDKAGLSIFESLQKNIHQLKLSSIYVDMLDDVSTQGHPYHRIFEKEGQKNIQYKQPISSIIIERCHNRALDQELYCESKYLPRIFRPLVELPEIDE